MVPAEHQTGGMYVVYKLPFNAIANRPTSRFIKSSGNRRLLINHPNVWDENQVLSARRDYSSRS